MALLWIHGLECSSNKFRRYMTMHWGAQWRHYKSCQSVGDCWVEFTLEILFIFANREYPVHQDFLKQLDHEIDLQNHFTIRKLWLSRYDCFLLMKHQDSLWRLHSQSEADSCCWLDPQLLILWHTSRRRPETAPFLPSSRASLPPCHHEALFLHTDY